MYDIIKKLMFSRQISFEEGKIKLLDQPVFISILKKKYKMSKMEMIKWAANSITLSGWGVVKIQKSDLSNCMTDIVIEDSTFAKLYGKSNESTDVLLQGFFAGGATEIFGKNVDCKEIKCVSKGDPVCEFIVK